MLSSDPFRAFITSCAGAVTCFFMYKSSFTSSLYSQIELGIEMVDTKLRSTHFLFFLYALAQQFCFDALFFLGSIFVVSFLKIFRSLFQKTVGIFSAFLCISEYPSAMFFSECHWHTGRRSCSLMNHNTQDLHAELIRS